MLVLAKTYQIAKAAVVPSTVAGEHRAGRGKLQTPAAERAFAAIVAGALGGILLQIGPEWVLALTTLTFGAAFVAALRIHPSVTGKREESEIAAGPPPSRSLSDALPRSRRHRVRDVDVAIPRWPPHVPPGLRVAR